MNCAGEEVLFSMRAVVCLRYTAVLRAGTESFRIDRKVGVVRCVAKRASRAHAPLLEPLCAVRPARWGRQGGHGRAR